MHLEHFYKRKDNPDGHINECKKCHSEKCKKYRQNNRDKLLEKKRQYYQENKETILAKSREYNLRNEQTIKQHKKEYRKANIDKIKEYRASNKEYYDAKNKEWYINNKDKKYQYNKIYVELNREHVTENRKRWRNENKEALDQYRIMYELKNKEKVQQRRKAYRNNNKEKYRELARQYYKEVKSKNPKYKIRKNMAQLIRNSLKNQKKNVHWEQLVGYTLSELTEHLEVQFLPGMSWDNYGFWGWHIDHKKPVAWFSFTSYEDPEFKECWSLSNLQPLWCEDNWRKGARTIS